MTRRSKKLRLDYFSSFRYSVFFTAFEDWSIFDLCTWRTWKRLCLDLSGLSFGTLDWKMELWRVLSTIPGAVRTFLYLAFLVLDSFGVQHGRHGRHDEHL